jgi:hypothetical protein
LSGPKVAAGRDGHCIIATAVDGSSAVFLVMQHLDVSLSVHVLGFAVLATVLGAAACMVSFAEPPPEQEMAIEEDAWFPTMASTAAALRINFYWSIMLWMSLYMTTKYFMVSNLNEHIHPNFYF